MTEFIHFPKRPKKLTAEFAKKHYDGLVARIAMAEESSTDQAWLNLYHDWNELKSYVGSEGSRIGHAFNKNMADKKLVEAEKYFREKVVPNITPGEHQLTIAFLDSRHRQAIIDKYGQQLVPMYETQVKPLDPVNSKLRVKAGRLDTQYDKMIAGAKLKIDGETMTLWKARTLGSSPDESIRKKAFLARGDWFLKNHQKLSSIFDQLVGLRDQMAKNVGYDNYTYLAYQNMGRTDFDAKMVEQFRASILKYIVPVRLKASQKLAESLSVSKLKPWNVAYNTLVFKPEMTLPQDAAPINTQLDNAQKLFENLSPILAKHFETMRREDLIDLENRPNKRSGAYCTGFSDEGRSAILLNSTGDVDDIRTLTHEMGHAFQGWESRYIEDVDLQHPTYELCEVHSMGMEFLSLSQIDTFLPNPAQADKFKKERWDQAIEVLCYVAVVDEFQHWVYANPKATPLQRDKQWEKIFTKYLPDVDFRWYKDYIKTRWYAQGHIFGMPFYYIDYALAEVCAMQLAVINSQSSKKALEVYLELCRLGGTKSFLAAIEAAGLTSPFDPKTVQTVALKAAQELGL